jgi:SAM-dependent methyltransferase
MATDPERERLAATFDRAADLYQRARPEYPAALFDRLVDVTGLRPGGRLLEIGAATGKATLPLARRGYRITCIEPGPALAAVARAQLAGFDVEVVERRFEDWDPGRERFDLVYAATAWHWLDPDGRDERVSAALQPSDVTLPRPQELPDRTPEIEASGLFEVVDVVQYDWETTHDADGYIELLNTFSGHIAMEDWQRDWLYGEIRRRLARRPDGRLRRHWGGVLHVARRRS